MKSSLPVRIARSLRPLPDDVDRSERAWEGFQLGMKLVPEHEEKLTEEDVKLAWFYADSDGNLPMQMFGRCSIRAMLDFNIEEYEKGLENDIVKMNGLLVVVRPRY